MWLAQFSTQRPESCRTPADDGWWSAGVIMVIEYRLVAVTTARCSDPFSIFHLHCEWVQSVGQFAVRASNIIRLKMFPYKILNFGSSLQHYLAPYVLLKTPLPKDLKGRDQRKFCCSCSVMGQPHPPPRPRPALCPMTSLLTSGQRGRGSLFQPIPDALPHPSHVFFENGSVHVPPLFMLSAAPYHL